MTVPALTASAAVTHAIQAGKLRVRPETEYGVATLLAAGSDGPLVDPAAAENCRPWKQ